MAAKVELEPSVVMRRRRASTETSGVGESQTSGDGFTLTASVSGRIVSAGSGRE